MKKALLMAACLMLTGVFLVNGTLAADFSKAISEVFADLSQIFQDALGGTPQEGGTSVDVALVSDDTPQNLYPGASAQRSTSVKNEGTGEVYFRLAYALQYDAQTWNKLDIEFNAEDGYAESEWMPIDVSGTEYMMKVFSYQQALESGAQSPAVSIRIAMDESITSQQMERYRSDFLQIQVLAIETKTFAENGYTTAEAALNAALPLNKLNPF